MINAAVTQPPVYMGRSGINASETIPPDKGQESSKNIVLFPGESVSESYVISSLMDKQGNQSDVYLAKKWGKTYVVKMYRNGWHPSQKMQTFLKNVIHRNIAHVIECGEHDGNYYEIYEYYSEGTLDDAGALSAAHIQNVIVPSINEGLHELHRNGIVHCDIKPSNLFYSDNRTRLIIGDCGISGYTNSNGKFVDAVRGTPEYAPRVKALLWNAAMSPAYDYGSFGLVLCRAVLGHSLFEGMSVEEISRAWENGIELPGAVNGRIAILIKGLLNEDEDQRWGYEQVRRWCEGEHVRSVNRNIYSGTNRNKQKNKPLIFGRFNSETLTVSTLHQLAEAIRAHWDQARRIVKRRELVEFVRQYEPNLTDKIRELARFTDEDAAVFRLLTYIDNDYDGIFFCGKTYGSLKEYVEALSSGKDETASRFLISGSLIFYLRYNEYEQMQVDKLEQLIKRNRADDMASIATICFALQGKTTYQIDGTNVKTLDDLVPVLVRMEACEIDKLIRDNDFIAWMSSLGYEKEMRMIREEYR